MSYEKITCPVVYRTYAPLAEGPELTETPLTATATVERADRDEYDIEILELEDSEGNAFDMSPLTDDELNDLADQVLGAYADGLFRIDG